MTSPDSGDVTLIKTGHHDLTPVINAVPMTVIATAQINQASFSYPLASVDIDTTVNWEDVLPGQMFLIGTAPGLADVTYGVVRKIGNNSVLYMDAKSLGDPGYARDIHVPIQDGYYITVLKYRPPWGLFSSIRNAVFYKKWDLPYNGSGSNPDPIVSMGPWRQAFVDSGGTATLSFSATAYTWNKILTSYAWGIDGATVISGDVDEDTVELEFDPGFYEITCQITDNKGKSRTGYRYVWINTTDPDDDFAPLSYKYPCIISRDIQDKRGRDISLKISGNIGPDVIFPGQAFLISEYPTFDHDTLTQADTVVDSYVGYSTEKETVTSRTDREITINLSSPMTLADKVPTGTQELTEVAAPSRWDQCTRVLSNPVGAFWYISAHHAPYLIDGHDSRFDITLIRFRRQAFGFHGLDIGSQMKELSDMILGNVGSNSAGTTVMLQDPNYFESAKRDALGTWWTWEPSDFKPPLSIPVNYRQDAVGQVYGYAFSYGGGSESKSYAALAPGFAKAQNPGQVSMTPFMVEEYLGQEYTERLTGHHYARLNNPIPKISLKVLRNADVAEPCNLDRWHVLNVISDWDPEDTGWESKRMLASRVTRTWNYESTKSPKVIDIQFEPETKGQRGVYIPVNRGAADTWITNIWIPDIDPYTPELPETGLDWPVMMAINDRGVLGRTFSFINNDVEWTRVVGFNGTPIDIVIDEFSPFLQSTGTAVRAWLLSWSGTSLYVYHTNDLKLTPVVWSLQKTLTVDASFNGKAKVCCSKTVEDFAVVAFKDKTGVQVCKTINGTSWGTAFHVGSTLTGAGDVDHDNDDIGFDICESRQVVLAPDGSQDAESKYQYFPYECNNSSTTSATFSAVGSVPTGERAILGGLVVNSTDNVILGMEDPAPPTPPTTLSPVTFEAGGFPDYDATVILIGEFSANIGDPTGGASTDYAAYYDFTTSGGNVGTKIHLGAQYIFNKLTFDVGETGAGSGPFAYITEVSCYDDDGNTVITKQWQELSEEGATGWKSEILADDLGAPDYFTEFEVRAYLVILGGSFTSWTLFMDDVDLQAELVERETVIKIRSIDLTGPTWSDISPKLPVSPLGSYSLAAAKQDSSKLALIGTEDNGYVFEFTNDGSLWTNHRRVRYVGVKRSNDALLSFGFNSIDLSLDKGATIFNRTGDWPARLGALSKILVVAGAM